jgi:hypothetical protein
MWNGEPLMSNINRRDCHEQHKQRNQIKGTNNNMPRRQLVEGETVAWEKSPAKKLLANDIISGTVPDTMHWGEVFGKRPEYQATARRLFANRLKSLREQINRAKGIAANEETALAHDRSLFPVPTHNYRGEPRWEGSEAERLLKEDVGNGLHKTMEPRQLYQTRPQYHNNYPLEVFRGHIYQEVRFVKFCKWRNDTGQQKADAWMK